MGLRHDLATATDHEDRNDTGWGAGRATLTGSLPVQRKANGTEPPRDAQPFGPVDAHEGRGLGDQSFVDSIVGAPVQMKPDDKAKPLHDSGGLQAEHDYTSEMIGGSKSQKTAISADREARDLTSSKEDPIPRRVNIDASHSFDMATRMRAYAAKHDDATYVKRAGMYMLDGDRLQRANDYYNQFVPQGELATRAIARFDAIDLQLGSVDIAATLAKHSGGMKKGIDNANLKTNKGLMSDAADLFDGARKTLMGAIEGYRQFMTMEVIAKLHAELAEAKEGKAKIEERIGEVSGILGKIGSLVSGGIGAGDLAGGGSGDAIGGLGTVVELGVRMFHAEDLAKIEETIRSSESSIKNWGLVTESQKAHAFVAQFQGAQITYKAAARVYMNALSSRRAQYADVGATADLSETGGKAPAQGKDASSQAMLYISAAREANIVLQHALSAATDAEKFLREASATTRYRDGRIYPAHDDLEQLEKTKGRKEQDAVGDALSYIFPWREFADNRKAMFEHTEESVKLALAKQGVGGDY